MTAKVPRGTEKSSAIETGRTDLIESDWHGSLRQHSAFCGMDVGPGRQLLRCDLTELLDVMAATQNPETGQMSASRSRFY